MLAHSRSPSPPGCPKSIPLSSDTTCPQEHSVRTFLLSECQISSPLLSAPLCTSRSHTEEERSIDMLPIVKHPIIPSGPLHTTRSDSEEEEEVSSVIRPILKPLKADVRGRWLKQEMKKREEEEALIIVTDDNQEMLPNIPDGELHSWGDPIVKWVPISHSGIPSWNKSPSSSLTDGEDEDDVILVDSSHGQSEDEDVDKKVMVNTSDFIVEFDEEVKKLPAMVINCYQFSNEEINEQVGLLDDKDEVVLVIGRYMIRTTKEGIEKARKDWEEGKYDNIGDIDEEDSEIEMVDDDSEVEIADKYSHNDDSEVEIVNEDSHDSEVEINNEIIIKFG